MCYLYPYGRLTDDRCGHRSDTEKTLGERTTHNEPMKDYIIDEEQHLSPIVTGTTIVLIGVFVLGVLYQLVGLLL